MDLAELYEVETKSLKRQVKRNVDRFPEDLFELNEKEFEGLRCQIGTSKMGRGGVRYRPLAFTEQGVAMLSSMLNSPREMLLNYKDVQLKLEQLERQTLQNTEDIQGVFAYLKQLLVPVGQAERERIGFRQRGAEN